MQYTTLGSSGLKISRIALGCMSFGDTSRGFNEWALDDTAAEPLFRQAVELGITFWDTANAYGYGTSEEIVGLAIRTYARREEVVLATKVYFTMHDGPGGSGLSRRAIIEQLDDSPAPARHRLRRSLPDPPLRPRHAGGGNDGGPVRQCEEEREMFGLLADQRVGSIPWSLARKRAARSPVGTADRAQRHRRCRPLGAAERR